nr:MAG TPA: hypothetical protein [Bacteriophage sp.]
MYLVLKVLNMIQVIERKQLRPTHINLQILIF